MNIVNPYRYGTTFLGLPLDFHIRSWEGITLNGSNELVSLTDLTGNGNDFIPHATDVILVDGTGIGGNQALIFDKTNSIYNNSVPGAASEVEYFTFCVYKLVGAQAGTLGVIMGPVASYSSFGLYFAHAHVTTTPRLNTSTSGNISSTNTGYTNYYAMANINSSVKRFSTNGETFIETAVSQNFFGTYWTIGGFRGDRMSNILFCEAGFMGGNFNLITTEVISDFEAYFLDQYGI